eukprot:2273658-Rhodomonas_salina.1
MRSEESDERVAMDGVSKRRDTGRDPMRERPDVTRGSQDVTRGSQDVTRDRAAAWPAIHTRR